MSISARDVVRTTTGIRISDVSDLISARTSRPSLRGRLRSSRIKSGRTAPAYLPRRCRKSIASTPSFATIRLLRILPSRNASCVRRTSAGLSSTSRISSGLLMRPSPLGNGETERRTFSRPRLHPDAAAVALDNLLADREPNPGAAVLFDRVQTLEDDEDPLEVLRRNADPVVADG